MIRLGDTDVEYHPGFQLYMTTPLANPHYLPEVCIKVTLVNFTVTRPGLEEQLLAELVRKERPDLQASRDRLLLSISNDKRQLKVGSTVTIVSDAAYIYGMHVVYTVHCLSHATSSIQDMLCTGTVDLFSIPKHNSCFGCGRSWSPRP